MRLRVSSGVSSSSSSSVPERISVSVDSRNDSAKATEPRLRPGRSTLGTSCTATRTSFTYGLRRPSASSTGLRQHGTSVPRQHTPENTNSRKTQEGAKSAPVEVVLGFDCEFHVVAARTRVGFVNLVHALMTGNISQLRKDKRLNHPRTCARTRLAEPCAPVPEVGQDRQRFADEHLGQFEQNVHRCVFSLKEMSHSDTTYSYETARKSRPFHH